MSPEDSRARTRFLIISLLRLMGALMVMFGIVIASERIASLPPALGYALIAAGFLDLLLVPRLLARRWRSPDP